MKPLVAAGLVAMPWAAIAAHGDARVPVRAPIVFGVTVAMLALAWWIARYDDWLGAACGWAVVGSWVVGSDWSLGVARFFTLGACGYIILRNETAPAWLWLALDLSVTAMVSVAMLQFAYGLPPTGAIGGSPRYLGAYVAILTPFIAWWCLPLVGLGIGLSQSWLALLAGVFGVFVKWRGSRAVPWEVRVAAALALLVVGTAAVYITRGFPTYTIGNRLEGWSALRHDITPVGLAFGMGPGGSALQIAKQGELMTPAHNEVIQWGYEEGAVGLVLLGGFVWARRRELLRLAPLIVLSLGFSPFRQGAVAATAVIAMALAYQEVHGGEKAEQGKGEGDSARQESPRQAPDGTAAPVYGGGGVGAHPQGQVDVISLADWALIAVLEVAVIVLTPFAWIASGWHRVRHG